MSKKVIKVSIIIFSTLAVLIPLWLSAKDISWAWNSTLPFNLFPLFGITAFSLLWLHVVGASLENWLRKYIDFEWFIEQTSLPILVLMLSHPLFLLIATKFNIKGIFASYPSLYLFIGITGLVFLLTYDIGKALKNRDFFSRNWDNILFISTVGVILIFFHSINLGHDVQNGILKIIWFFYGITATISAVYVYIIKKFIG